MKEIFAFNSKGKSFNNTDSADSLLSEYPGKFGVINSKLKICVNNFSY